MEVDTEHQAHGRINGHRDLRHGGEVGRRDRADLRTLLDRRHELGRIGRQEVRVGAETVLEDEGRAARCSDTRDRRRGEGEVDRSGNGGDLLVDGPQETEGILTRLGALFPRLERDEVEGAVGVLDAGEEIEADDGRHVLNTRDLTDDVGNLLGNRVRPLLGGGVRELGEGVEVAVVLFRHEGTREL